MNTKITMIDSGVTSGSIYTYDTNWNATTPAKTEINIKQSGGLSPKVYFKYVKKKFGFIEKIRLESRIKKTEKMMNDALGKGQVALSEELFERIVKETRESEMYVKGFKIFIEEEFLEKFPQRVDPNYWNNNCYLIIKLDSIVVPQIKLSV
jgi:hypothetical protein